MAKSNSSSLHFLYSLITFLGISAIVTASPSYPTQPSIAWGNCTEQDPAGLQCGQLIVPLDHTCNKPNCETIKLAIARLKASKSNGTSHGSLLFNPGGPGGAAVEIVVAFANGQAPFFSPEISSYYDIIGFDPRGVGQSSAVKCDPKVLNQRVATAAADQKSFDALMQYNKAVGESCAKLTGPLINHLDTIHVVRDMELIRQALKSPKLNFLGLSYGSYIGAAYAELFPNNVGKMALDGILDHSQAPVSTLQTESSTYEATLRQFFTWSKTSDESLLKGEDAEQLFTSLVATAQKKPINAPGCKATGEGACRSDVNAEELLTNVQDMLGSQEPTVAFPGWAALAEALAQAAKGNATILSSKLAVAEDDGSYSGTAIGCQDFARPINSLSDLKALTAMTSALSPLTKGFTQTFGYQTRCIGWPAPVTNPQRELKKSIEKTPDVLLVNSLYDPECSVQWAVGMREQWTKARLVFRKGNGHTSYLLFGQTSKAIDAFLMGESKPEDGTMFES